MRAMPPVTQSTIKPAIEAAVQSAIRPAIQVGSYHLHSNLILAPMAGITDRPFRMLCKEFGAGLAVGEMLTADSSLWHTRKSQWRMNHTGEPEPIAVQIAGGDPEMLAEAARLNVENGAQIIDINMGCPAKKVCNKAAGSALLANEKLVADILQTVVAAVDVPVTLKIRTGPDPARRNAHVIARIAEDAGVQMLAIHGRTRRDAFKGHAEYDTIAAVKQQLSIPVIANGDLNDPEHSRKVLEYTAADGLMFGRGAQGKPWIFQEIEHFLRTGTHAKPLNFNAKCSIILRHLKDLYAFYGDLSGVRIARKHIGWYLKPLLAFIAHNDTTESATMQPKNWFQQAIRSEQPDEQYSLVQQILAAMDIAMTYSINETDSLTADSPSYTTVA